MYWRCGNRVEKLLPVAVGCRAVKLKTNLSIMKEQCELPQAKARGFAGHHSLVETGQFVAILKYVSHIQGTKIIIFNYSTNV